ncbi:chymotrypsinogen B-like [Leguminivora glycinivorella]|uniref:chymotrypsinogen B-like n=1 Tax=Leguminivora glycinivorella TaxID=1035111 RepID=UPI00200CDABB|nr:chymotrypsinogen B-like [Leguminivora glycinivorella]
MMYTRDLQEKNLTPKEPFEPVGVIGIDDIIVDQIDRSVSLIHPREKFCHPAYSAAGNGNDICLLKLNDTLTFGDKVAKITLPEADLVVNAGTLLNVTGWGRTEVWPKTIVEASAISYLRQVSVPLMSDATCKANYPAVDTDIQICAGATGLDACQGDSGGPLTLVLVVCTCRSVWCPTGVAAEQRVEESTPSHPLSYMPRSKGSLTSMRSLILGSVQIGVVSYGRRCGTSSGGVYAKVTSYLDWIHDTINNNL